MSKTLATFDGKYGRIGTIKMGNGKCVVCNTNMFPSLIIDQSDGEYHPCILCFHCMEYLRTNGHFNKET